MRIRPFDELLAESRQRYQEWRKRKADGSGKPKVINVEAVLVFGQPRVVTWGAIKYHAPPLTYRQGMKLLTAANALEDQMEHGAAESDVQATIRLAARCVREAVRPRSRVRRLFWRFSRAFQDEPDLLIGLIWWLLDVRDQAGYPPPDKPVTVDYLDAKYAFIREYPALCVNGEPRSWADYLYGNRHLMRAHTREDLRHASAVRAGVNADKKEFERYDSDLRSAAGW